MPRTAWKLTDTSTGVPVTVEFDVNPNTATYPGRRANITQRLVTAPNGNVVVFQGRDEPKEMRFSGAVHTENFYNTLKQWSEKWVVLELEDDLGNTFDVLIISWEWERLRRALHPYRFDYSAQLFVL